jgi:hypothetical protein
MAVIENGVDKAKKKKEHAKVIHITGHGGPIGL